MVWPDALADLPVLARILLIAMLAMAAHFVVRGVRFVGERLIAPSGTSRDALLKGYPKAATIITILVSALTFIVYFGAVGLVLREFGVNLATYLASASVIGLAVGFGSQGLVQDIVIGLTLIFSDVLNVGEVVDLSGQTGRVDRIGLRFTCLVNLHDQVVYVPNRNITQINRYRNGYIRAYVDIQLPTPTAAPTEDSMVDAPSSGETASASTSLPAGEAAPSAADDSPAASPEVTPDAASGYDETEGDAAVGEGLAPERVQAIQDHILSVARGMHAAHSAIVLTPPEFLGIHTAHPGAWRYLRLKFRLWPGQGALIETTFRQRVLALLKATDPGYADWMITVTYRADEPRDI